MQLQDEVSYALRVEEPSPATQAVISALETHRPSLRAFVNRRTGAALADDVLQVAAIRALEKAETLRDPSHVLSWLYKIHRSALADTGRKVASRQRWEDSEKEVSDTPDLAESGPPDRCQCSAYQARMLKPAYAEILKLVDLQGGSVSDVSAALGISVNNATVRLHRARAALRAKMFEHCGVERASDCIDCSCTDNGCCVG